MKIYTLTEAADALQADSKTLREWINREGWKLADAGTHKYDKRIKSLTEEQVVLLAKVHNRAWPPKAKPATQGTGEAAGINGAVNLLKERVDALREDHIGITMFNRSIQALEERLQALESKHVETLTQLTDALLALKELQDWKASQESRPKPGRRPKAAEGD
jgi:hypothetical protein